MATLLKERSTYWVLSGGSSANSNGDYRMYWKIYYEQSDEDKKLLRTKLTVNYYVQISIGSQGEVQPPTTTSICYIDGSSIGSKSFSSKYYQSSGLYSLGSATKYITHNTDGTASFTFRGTGFGLGTSTTTYTLPKITVGTEITNNTSSSNYINLDSEVTFTLNDLTGQVEANKLYYKINNTEYVISESTTATTVKYSFPVDIITNFPNNANISLTIYCKNLVSNVETTTTVYLKLPDSYVPTASLSIEDVMSNKPSVLSGLWIKNQSKLKGTITAGGVKGSSIKSYLSSISGFSQQYNTNPFTTQPLTVAGSRTISSTITDSRDRKKTITQTINVIDYNKPTFVSLSVKRCLQDGTISESGTYAKVICKYNISPINNLNTKTLKVYLNGEWEDVNTLSSYSGEFSKVVYNSIKQEKSYTLKVVLTDLFGDVQQEFLLGVAYKTVSKRAGGKGITFGAVATKDGFHNYMTSRFYDEARFDGNVIMGSGISSDPTNSFQSSLFGKLNYYWRFKVVRSEFNTNNNFPHYSTGIAFTGGDTHGYLMTDYYHPRCIIGGGAGDQLRWIRQVAWKDDQSQLMGVYTGSTTISSTAHVKLTLTEKVRNGSLLSISNGGIRIGAGVTKVEVSGNVYFSTGMNSGDSLRSFIYKNDEVIAHNFNRCSGTYEDRPISPVLLNVSEGDIIYLYGSNASAGRGIITENNYLVVKVIG